MSNGINRVVLVGNLGDAPTLRFTSNDKAVLTIRMATGDSYFDEKQGKRVETVEWHTVVIWGPRATALEKLLRKGERVAVEGKLKTRKWQADDGSDRYSTEIEAHEVVLCGGKVVG